MTSDPGGRPRSQASVDLGDEGGERRRPSLLDVLRWLFLVAAVGFGWWGLRAYHAEIGAALGQTSPGRVLGSLVVVLGGLLLTGAVWRTVLAAMGHAVPARAASAIFFVGQLGKYIPGSVWSLGAQADMARRYHVPVRTTVAVGLVFLWVHVVTALPAAALLGIIDEGSVGSVSAPGPLAQWVAQMPAWAVPVAVALALLATSPVVMRWIGRVLAGPRQPLRLTWSQSMRLLGLMAVVWLAYGVGLYLVLPPEAVAAASGGHLLGVSVAAFAVAYVVGVVVVLAPAGAAVRELTLIGLLAPLVGVPVAAAAAILIRVVHTVADFTMAGLAWWAAGAQRRAASATRATEPDDRPQFRSEDSADS